MWASSVFKKQADYEGLKKNSNNNKAFHMLRSQFEKMSKITSTLSS